MSLLVFSVIAGTVALAAGLVGSFSGFGSGMIIIPFLTVVLGVDIRYAIGASLISVIATSSGTAVREVRSGCINIKLSMILGAGTTLGAVLGAHLATILPPNTIVFIFGLTLLSFGCVVIGLQPRSFCTGPLRTSTDNLHLDGSYISHGVSPPLHMWRIQLGLGLGSIAGALSGLLGIGLGEFKVLTMDQVMGLPREVSAATGNLIFAITAAVSASAYLNRGYISPSIAMPVVIGALLGSSLGSHAIRPPRSRSLQVVFALLMVGVAGEMIYKGIVGGR